MKITVFEGGEIINEQQQQQQQQQQLVDDKAVTSDAPCGVCFQKTLHVLCSKKHCMYSDH